MAQAPPVNWGHIEDPALRQWLEGLPPDWQRANHGRNPHALLHEMVDGMAAEAIAQAHRPEVDVGAMSPDDFVAYMNAQIAARDAQASGGQA